MQTLSAQASLLQQSRIKPLELVFWLLAFAAPVLTPSHALIINEIAIVALFAISLDIILGYTGIVSLGHAAFFGLGGALGAEVLGLDPTFPLKFMVYFLIVVAVGGTSSITGPLLAALLLGIADVAGKYYIPKLGAFIVYSLMIAILIWRPQGLFVRKAGK